MQEDCAPTAASATNTNIHVAIDDTRLCEPGPFREYRISISLGGSTWDVWRRYSQFDALRSAMCSGANPNTPARASLPPKGFLQPHSTAVERMPALDSWLSAVVSCEASLSSPSLLAFLGMLDMRSNLETRGRAPVHVRALTDRRYNVHGTPAPVESGDLMLFRTRAMSEFNLA